MLNKIRDEIVNDLDAATYSIKVAVSWLTDLDLLNALMAAAKRGIEVKIVVSNSVENLRQHKLLYELNAHGGDIRRWGANEPLQGSFMHYKFYIIDNIIAKSGSYNWTTSAITNKETLDIVDLDKKEKQFSQLFQEATDYFLPFVFNEQKNDPNLGIALTEGFNRFLNDAATPSSKNPYINFYRLLSNEKEYHKIYGDILKLKYAFTLKNGARAVSLDEEPFGGIVIDTFNQLKLIDLLYVGNDTLTISQKAHDVLIKSKHNNDGDSIKFEIKKNDTTFVYYTPLLNKITSLDQMPINFKLSSFKQDKKPLRLNSYEQYGKEIKRWVWADRKKQYREADKLVIEINKLVLIDDGKLPDWFAYKSNIFVSEGIIRKIEEAGLTGFNFSID